MARYDKYDPKTGGYRATLAADFDKVNLEKALGVGHDANGRLVIGKGVSGVKGVLVLTKAHPAGTRVDPMTAGEITEFGPSDSGKVPGTDFGTAGTNYYAHDDGTITATKGSDGVYVGFTVEAQRLIVRVETDSTYTYVAPEGASGASGASG